MTIIQNAGTGEVSTGFYNNVVTQSLRFEDGDTPSLSKTYGSAGDRQKFTFSAWVKRNNFVYSELFSTGANSSNKFEFAILATGEVWVEDVASGSAVFIFQSTRKLRDTSAWYHIMLSVDTTNGTSGNRVRIYVNGDQLTSFDTYNTQPSQNDNSQLNADALHTIGKRSYSAAHADMYLAEVNFIDGTALGPDSFGETKSGIWIPKDTSGLTFGTNGFRLQFEQTGTGTASTSTIGADTSGNNNHFTSTNLAATDSNMPDCPENNFATLNRLVTRAGTPTLSEGNLKLTGSGTDYDRSYATIGLTSGKWYAEFLYVSGDNRGMFGVVREDARASDASDIYIGSILNTFGIDFRARVYTGTGSSSDGQELFDGTDFDTGDIGLLCFDIDNGKLWFGRRDVSGSSTIWYDSNGNNNGDPSAGSNPTYTGTYTGHTWFIGCHDYNGTTIITNFGQDGSFAGALTSQGVSDANGIGDFNYIESGFLALCTSNLPDPAIDPAKDDTPADYFNTVLYTGNSTDGRAISGVGFQPDWVWVKERGAVNNHILSDSVRGATKGLHSDSSTTAEFSDVLASFNADGFVVSDHGTVNNNNDTYVAWNWKAGTAFSNDASATSIGSIDSTGSVSTKAGFSIISYTGTGSAATVAHGLGAVPTVYICKARTDTGADENWLVYHSQNTAAPETDYLLLNSNQGTTDDADAFNDTAPTSTVFSIGSFVDISKSGVGYIAYVFTDIEGFAKHGSYVGNGNSSGPFIYTGFRPAWIMQKKTNNSGHWHMWDSTRNTSNEVTRYLLANANNSEYTDGGLDILSNGFKPRKTGTGLNADGDTYIYLAFAEQPFKYANAR